MFGKEKDFEMTQKIIRTSLIENGIENEEVINNISSKIIASFLVEMLVVMLKGPKEPKNGGFNF